MSNRLSLEYADLLSTLKRVAVLPGHEVLGPKEGLFGSVNHEYRRIDDSTILQLQNFTVIEPYDLRFSRKNFVVFQFTKHGNYQRSIGDVVDFISPATVQITNAPDTVSHMSARGQRLVGVGIAVEREYLTDHYGLNVESVPAQYRAIFTSSKGLPCSLKLPLSAISWSRVEEILACSLMEPLRSVYLQVRTLDLICDVVLALNNGTSKIAIQYAPSQNRMERRMVEAAAAMLMREVDNPPSIAEIASRVGLHRNRLIAGFQDIFQMAPSAYSRKLRMERAKELLVESNLSIGQVASSIGYNNHAAFSRAFHAYFGFPPSDAVKK